MMRLIAAATGHSEDGNQTRLRACVLLGQVGWSHFDEHALDLIKLVVREHTRGALTTLHGALWRPGRIT